MTAKIQWIATTPSETWVTEKVSPEANTSEPNLVVTHEKRQMWRGFGGCFNELEWKTLTAMPNENRELILRDLFLPGYECQFNFCRVPIGANDYAESWYSCNEVEDDFEMKHFNIERDRKSLIPFIKAAQRYQPDLKLFASPWSPPTWMKFPKVYNYGRMIWDAPVLKAYALYLLIFVKAYEAEGIPIEQVHVQNEPMSDQKFPSCIWIGTELRDFIRDYMGPLFEKEGVKTEIWLGTLNGPEVDERFLITTYNDYANQVLSDPEARKYVRGVGYQWRGKYAIQRTRQGWPEIPVIQTENECGDGSNTWEYAWYVFDLMYHYITNDAEAYVYWNMVLPPGGESTWGWKQNTLITVNPKTGEIIHNPEYYIMKHFSKFIKPGMHRIVLKNEWSANAVGFQDASGKETVLVIRNPFVDSRSINMTFEGELQSFLLKPESINTILIKKY